MLFITSNRSTLKKVSPCIPLLFVNPFKKNTKPPEKTPFFPFTLFITSPKKESQRLDKSFVLTTCSARQYQFACEETTRRTINPLQMTGFIHHLFFCRFQTSAQTQERLCVLQGVKKIRI